MIQSFTHSLTHSTIQPFNHSIADSPNRSQIALKRSISSRWGYLTNGPPHLGPKSAKALLLLLLLHFVVRFIARLTCLITLHAYLLCLLLLTCFASLLNYLACMHALLICFACLLACFACFPPALSSSESTRLLLLLLLLTIQSAFYFGEGGCVWPRKPASTGTYPWWLRACVCVGVGVGVGVYRAWGMSPSSPPQLSSARLTTTSLMTVTHSLPPAPTKPPPPPPHRLLLCWIESDLDMKTGISMWGGGRSSTVV